MSDETYLRADDTGALLLDNEGNPIRELTPDSADALLDHGAALAELAIGERSWRFGHVIVDEAQDLTPMQWRMVVRRARGRSMTIVGDLAQRSVAGDVGRDGTGWLDVLPAELADHDYRELTINYRSPQEVATLAAGVLADHAPGLTASRAIRASGHDAIVIDVSAGGGSTSSGAAPTTLGAGIAAAIERIKRHWSGGRLAVIGATDTEREDVESRDNEIAGISWLDAWSSKGLEFDAVVVVEPSRITARQNGMSLLYVAITRTTDWLAIVHAEPLPRALAAALGSTPQE